LDHSDLVRRSKEARSIQAKNWRDSDRHLEKHIIKGVLKETKTAEKKAADGKSNSRLSKLHESVESPAKLKKNGFKRKLSLV